MPGAPGGSSVSGGSCGYSRRVVPGLVRRPSAVDGGPPSECAPSRGLGEGGLRASWVERGAKRHLLSRNGGTPLVAATREVIRACIGTLRTGAPPRFPAIDGVDCLRVVAGAYRAAELGHVVQLDGADGEAAQSMSLAEEIAR